MDAGDHGDAGADPHVLPQHNGGGVGGGALFRVEVVVHRGEDHVAADHGAVPKDDAPLVVEVAAGVDEHPFAHGDVFAAVGVKGREEAEALVHRLADELGEDVPNFRLGVVLAVEVAGQTHGLLVELSHKLMKLAAALNGRAAGHKA